MYKTYSVKFFRIFRVVVACMIVACVGFYFFPETSNAAPETIVVNHPTVTITEGSLVTIQVILSEPIICPTVSTTTEDPSTTETTLPPPIDPDDPNTCKVDVPLTVSDPSRVSINTSRLRWLSNEWAQQRTFTITVNHDSIDNPPGIVTVGGTATSNSEFYNGYAISVAVTVTDPDDVTTTTSTTTTTTIEPTTTTTTSDDSPIISLSDSTIQPGGTTTVEGRNFKPDSDATVTLHSSPVLLGKVHTNSSGSFSQTFAIPKSTAQGAHQIVVDGLDASGNSVSSVQALTVTELPETGSNLLLNGMLALLLIGVGAVVVVTCRKLLLN